MTTWWEDVEVGLVREAGPVVMDEAEIIAFGREYDPQTYHMDPEGARATAFGGLIASGWHTCSVVMSLIVASGGKGDSIVSPGFDDLRYLRPVRPGDRISARLTFTGKSNWGRRSDIGLVTMLTEAFNQNGEKVLEMTNLGLYPRRNPPEGQS